MFISICIFISLQVLTSKLLIVETGIGLSTLELCAESAYILYP